MADSWGSYKILLKLSKVHVIKMTLNLVSKIIEGVRNAF